MDKILSPQIRFVFKLQTYDFGLNLIKDHDTRLRKSSMSLSRNIDKWTVTMPGCTMYICILLWLVTDTRFWLAIYETHPNITSDSLHKDPHLRDTGNIPLPAPPPRPLPILVLLSSLVNSEQSVPGIGCQILESHNWPSARWTNSPSHPSSVNPLQRGAGNCLLAKGHKRESKLHEFYLMWNIGSSSHLICCSSTICQTKGVVSWMTVTCWR